MLKTGIYLFSSASLGVLYRCADMPYAMLPLLKWFCFLGLSLSLFCFILTYVRFTMIKSTEWKASSHA